MVKKKETRWDATVSFMIRKKEDVVILGSPVIFEGIQQGEVCKEEELANGGTMVTAKVSRILELHLLEATRKVGLSSCGYIKRV